MADHTPGPWQVEDMTLAVVAHTPEGDRFHVADMRGWGHLTGKGLGARGLPYDEAIAIQSANARLIAAAPEMLKALKAVEEWWLGTILETGMKIPAVTPGAPYAIFAVRAAIAAAQQRS